MGYNNMDQHSNFPPSDNSLSFASHADDTLLPQGQRVPFINGAKWIDQSIKMALQQPKTWLIVILFFLALDLISEYVMSDSSSMRIVTLCLTTVLSAGIVCIAESQRLTGQADVQLIGKGFSERLGGIFGVVLIQVGIVFVGIIFSLSIIGLDSLAYFEELVYAAVNDNQERVADIILLIGVGRIIAAILFFIISIILAEMFTRFAIPFMMLENYTVGQALKSSFKGCLKNIPAAFVYIVSLIILVAIYMGLVFMLPSLENVLFILWSIVIVPCTYIATYMAYRDIFYQKSLIQKPLIS